MCVHAAEDAGSSAEKEYCSLCRVSQTLFTPRGQARRPLKGQKGDGSLLYVDLPLDHDVLLISGVRRKWSKSMQLPVFLLWKLPRQNIKYFIAAYVSLHCCKQTKKKIILWHLAQHFRTVHWQATAWKEHVRLTLLADGDRHTNCRPIKSRKSLQFPGEATIENFQPKSQYRIHPQPLPLPAPPPPPQHTLLTSSCNSIPGSTFYRELWTQHRGVQ